MHSGPGKNPRGSRRYLRRNFAVWDADIRSISVGPVPGRADQLRNRTGERLQRRRLQAAYARHFFHQRYFQKRDATDRLRWPLIYPPETLEGALKRALSYFGGGRNLTSTVKPTAEPTRSSGPVKSSCS